MTDDEYGTTLRIYAALIDAEIIPQTICELYGLHVDSSRYRILQRLLKVHHALAAQKVADALTSHQENFANAAPRTIDRIPQQWTASGIYTFRRGLFGGAVLYRKEIKSAFRPKYSGHTPANWTRDCRWRRVKLSEALTLKGPSRARPEDFPDA